MAKRTTRLVQVVLVSAFVSAGLGCVTVVPLPMTMNVSSSNRGGTAAHALPAPLVSKAGQPVLAHTAPSQQRTVALR
jgi:hypothetical protein